MSPSWIPSLSAIFRATSSLLVLLEGRYWIGRPVSVASRQEASFSRSVTPFA